MEPLLRNALDYAGRGWPVFLLGRTKRPMANCDACRDAGPDHDRDACPCLFCHGLYAATTDPERIAAMVAAQPTGLLAIRTGAVAGLVVVDIDPGHGGALDPALMPQTACVVTGSGGWHLYYRHPGTPVLNSQGRLGEGIDVRGDGGYVVAPPSIHPRTRRPYRWAGGRPVVEMPPALITACRPAPAATTTTPRVTSSTPAGGISSPDALLRSLLDTVRHAPKGRRRSTLYGCARGVARMVAADAISLRDAMNALYDAGMGAGQTDRETRAAIAGGFRDEGVAA
ncbi:bifunctional DNA primase/polymerase [Dactylosporangium vinaceum]|uniref:Bifunctional DNA primase/polymerase n=1 Tax=Dactylosporangium vinaceum TaxID=53362 RepID=A0ABV5MH07_9ACTN|nr:bifunctional DNA primase/polymerase [Dactylosporangium vinaceum]UAB94903.1 bifunctional DNA primase/polymerase [Dactylosporangium vinaceum]